MVFFCCTFNADSVGCAFIGGVVRFTFAWECCFVALIRELLFAIRCVSIWLYYATDGT